MFLVFLSSAIKFLFLFGPFFVVTMFLVLTAGESDADKTRIAIRSTISAFVICLIIFFIGPALFQVVGITLDSFRIGAGSLLFLTSVGLVNNGVRIHAKGLPDEDRDDVAVVPLSMPVIVGPATIGTVLVMGAELTSHKEVVAGLLGMTVALGAVLASMLLSNQIKSLLGKTGLNIMSKMTGLILAAMAADIVFTGIQGYLL